MFAEHYPDGLDFEQIISLPQANPFIALEDGYPADEVDLLPPRRAMIAGTALTPFDIKGYDAATIANHFKAHPEALQTALDHPELPADALRWLAAHVLSTGTINTA